MGMVSYQIVTSTMGNVDNPSLYHMGHLPLPQEGMCTDPGCGRPLLECQFLEDRIPIRTGTDIGNLGFPSDLTPYDFGFPFYYEYLGGPIGDYQYVPCFMDLYDGTAYHGFRRDSWNMYAPQTAYQIRDQLGYQSFSGGHRHMLMETLETGMYFPAGPGAVTMWGVSDSQTNNMDLFAYWHDFSKLYEDQVYDNHKLPGLVGPFSWTINNMPEVSLLVDKNNNGGLIPAFATAAYGNKRDIVYSRLNVADPALAYADLSMPGVTVSQIVSTFPTIYAYQGNKTYRDLIDATYGASILSKRNNELIGFVRRAGTGPYVEQPVSTPAVAEEEPLCVAFIQTKNQSAAEAPGYELYYGEIYMDSTGGSPVGWFELVDDIEIARLDNAAETNGYPKWVDKGSPNPNPNPHANDTIANDSFHPLWCAIGMTALDLEGGEGRESTSRTVPVISYGVRCTGEGGEGQYGQLKVAAPVRFMPVPPEFDIEAIMNKIYQYTSIPDDQYPGGIQSQDGLNDLNS